MRIASVVRVLTIFAVAGLLVSPQVALAKAPPPHLSAHAVAASFKVGQPVLVAGTVTPASTAVVVLQRLVGKSWVSAGHAKPLPAGTFTLSVKAPSKPTAWKVRVVRPKARHVAAITGASFVVHVVKTAFGVTASTSAATVSGSPVVVTGVVSPKATGTVLLQTTGPAGWYTFASAKLTARSAYTLQGILPLGDHPLRVLKAATTKVAQGLSPVVRTTVALPPLVVGTTALPAATVELPYSVQLSATGGLAPYTWSASGLPAGLALSSSGLLTGTIGTASTVTVTIVVTDARSVTASTTLPMSAYPSPHAADLVRAWGDGAAGQLGNNQVVVVPQPVTVGLAGLVQVSAGSGFAAAVRFNGDVWTWGDNTYDQLGVDAGVTPASAVPLQVPGLSGITAVAAGYATMYALGRDGTVWAWGYGGDGRLGDGAPTAMRATPVRVAGLTNVVAIAAGEISGYAVKADGTVWAWGGNPHGALGDGTTASRSTPVQVQAPSGITRVASSGDGGQTAYALRNDGTAWAWGNNFDGQIGDGTTTDRPLPVQIPGLSGVTDIAGGDYNGYAVTSSGGVWAWGYNGNNGVGDGTSTDRLSPVALAITGAVSLGAGYNIGFVTLADGTAKAWGDNFDGGLGDGTTTNRLSPVVIPGLTHVRQIAGSEFDGYAVTGS